MNANNLKWGVSGGLAGGVVFGAMMGMMGMLPMIGGMIGQPSAAAGAAVHLVNSAVIGAGFAVILGRLVSGVRNTTIAGLLYGAAWWVVGPLTLMPLFMGMGFGVNWTAAAAITMLPSLGGHLVYGTILGASYAWSRQRGAARALATVA